MTAPSRADYSVELDLFRKPVPTPQQVRGRLFRDHALDARPLSGTCWRVVEAQHHVSTLKLVDTVEEQRLLEALIEDTKLRYHRSAGTFTTCCTRHSAMAPSTPPARAFDARE